MGEQFKRSIAIFLLASFPAAAAAPAPEAPVDQFQQPGSQEPGPPQLSKKDIELLDDISRRSFKYFWEQTNLR
ncbi:MAG TPA: hypothetical protein VG672_27090, partial [Bryobacteraceae bacterium]|nr:hypothetical protein [Bryobacteraceae bacterium]